MKIEQLHWTGKETTRFPSKMGAAADLVFVFAGRSLLENPNPLQELRRLYPKALWVGCSTSGEICQTRVTEDTLVATAIDFEKTKVLGAQVAIEDPAHSFEAGRQLAKSFDPKGLVHLFVLSDGLHVNGSELVKGLTQTLPASVTITGGLSGDGARFQKTLVYFGDEAREKRVVGIGFYGQNLRVGCGSLGGWDPFGPDRLITKSKGNILYEMDGQSALALYKSYLGDAAADLPASGLLFPLSVRVPNQEVGIVRTILAVDEKAQSLTFAGDVPEGAYARLMKANFDRLIDGATGAAQRTLGMIGKSSPDLAILISCVGRKLVLKQRIEEEVEGVRQVLGEKPVLAGFYSYGEISPFTPSAQCELHNQTMTISTFLEE